jgi:hypothetical protein
MSLTYIYKVFYDLSIDKLILQLILIQTHIYIYGLVKVLINQMSVYL